MLSDVLWVNVMHSKTSDKCRTNNRSLKASPSIAGPMHHPRYPVNQKLGNNKSRHNTDWVLLIVGDGVMDELSPQAGCEDEEA